MGGCLEWYYIVMEKQVQGVVLVIEGAVLHTLYNKGKHLKTIGPLEVVNK